MIPKSLKSLAPGRLANDRFVIVFSFDFSSDIMVLLIFSVGGGSDTGPAKEALIDG